MLVLPAAGVAAPPVEGSPPEEPALPQLSFEPGSYDFGLRQANRETIQADLRLRNVGAVTAPVYSLGIVGPGAGAYWIDAGGTNCYGGSLEPGEACTVRVSFGPNDAVPFSAQLRAGSGGGASFTADLSGEGGRAEIGPAVDPTNFGATAVGLAGVTRTIEVANRGNYPGGAFIAVIAGGAIGSFHLIDENCTGFELSPGASCTLLVNFQPLSTGVKTARLGLFGDSDGGAQVTLTGIGLEPEPVSAPGAAQAPVVGSAPAARKHRPRRGRIVRRHRRFRAAIAARSKID
jgi:hypothetical protein